MNEISEKVAAGSSEGKNKKMAKSREQMFHKESLAVIIILIIAIAIAIAIVISTISITIIIIMMILMMIR